VTGIEVAMENQEEESFNNVAEAVMAEAEDTTAGIIAVAEVVDTRRKDIKLLQSI
jgi:flavin-binding protein dodecin